jgi:tetratricopeptide (TPR) repeat protein
VIRRGEPGILNAAMPAVRQFESGDTDKARELAAECLQNPKKSKHALTRFCARAVLVAEEGSELELDPYLLDAMRRDLEDSFGARPNFWVPTEYRLGVRLFNAELFEASLLVFEDVIARQAGSQRFLKESHRTRAVRSSRAYLATCLAYVGRYAEAVEIYEELCPIWEQEVGASDPRCIDARGHLGDWLAHLERYEEARDTLERAAELSQGRTDMTDRRDAIVTRLGIVRCELGDFQGAVEALSVVLPLLEARWGDGSLPVDICRDWLGRASAELP